MANDQMIAETIASNGTNLERSHTKRAKPPGSTLPYKSPKEERRAERLKFYKAFALDVMKKTQGFFSCQVCGGTVDSPDDLDLMHIERSGRGGVDHFSNLMLGERGPHTRQCHERFDGNLLQWSSGKES